MLGAVCTENRAPLPNLSPKASPILSRSSLISAGNAATSWTRNRFRTFLEGGSRWVGKKKAKENPETNLNVRHDRTPSNHPKVVKRPQKQPKLIPIETRAERGRMESKKGHGFSFGEIYGLDSDTRSSKAFLSQKFSLRQTITAKTVGETKPTWAVDG